MILKVWYTSGVVCFRWREELWVQDTCRQSRLHSTRSAVLNFETMKDNILSELETPQDSRRTLNIVTPYHFRRNLEQKKIQIVPRVKQYGLVFDKRVVDVETKSSHPYGYERIGDEVDLLLDL